MSFLKQPDNLRCLCVGLSLALFIYFYWFLRSGEDLKAVGMSRVPMATLFCGSHHDNRNEDSDSNNNSLFMLENACK